MKLYGSLQNRLEEGHQWVEEIKVGTGITEYQWSDRTPYEVVEVIDQKHIAVREMAHELDGEPMTNSWKLISDTDKPIRRLERRGDIWYWTYTFTVEDLKAIDEGEDINRKIGFVLAGWNREKILAKGKQTKREKANISIGKAEYYYDYSF